MFKASELLNIALVSKQWKEFSEPFILRSMGTALLQDFKYSKAQLLKYETTNSKKKKIIENNTMITIRTAVVRNQTQFMAIHSNLISNCHAIAFVFDSEGILSIHFSRIFYEFSSFIKFI